MCSRNTRDLFELLIEHGPSLPHSRALGDGLFGLRSRGHFGIGRAFYYFAIGRRVVGLHALVKKDAANP